MWKYTIPKEYVIFLKLELRKKNSTIEIAECSNLEKVHILNQNLYSKMIHSFGLNKIIVQNIPMEFDDYDIHVCCIHRVGESEFKKECKKYAKLKIKLPLTEKIKSSTRSRKNRIGFHFGIFILLLIGIFVITY
ncbi:hypothetical protein MXB_2767, partial [Myxobolus squamalis]